jgi:hypothetical protein
MNIGLIINLGSLALSVSSLIYIKKRKDLSHPITRGMICMDCHAVLNNDESLEFSKQKPKSCVSCDRHNKISLLNGKSIKDFNFKKLCFLGFKYYLSILILSIIFQICGLHILGSISVFIAQIIYLFKNMFLTVPKKERVYGYDFHS